MTQLLLNLGRIWNSILSDRLPHILKIVIYALFSHHNLVSLWNMEGSGGHRSGEGFIVGREIS